jgi:Ca2+-binding EF-hand superfamily protein
MKKTIYLLAFAISASAATAQGWSFFDACDKNEDGKVTEAEFAARNKKESKKKGKTFDPVVVKSIFDGRDLDGNGILSRDELDNAPAKKKKKKKKK